MLVPFLLRSLCWKKNCIWVLWKHMSGSLHAGSTGHSSNANYKVSATWVPACLKIFCPLFKAYSTIQKLSQVRRTIVYWNCTERKLITLGVGQGQGRCLYSFSFFLQVIAVWTWSQEMNNTKTKVCILTCLCLYHCCPMLAIHVANYLSL